MTKEELENQKLQSEIDKNKAEEEKAKSEARYFEKQINDVWYSGRSLKVIISSAITALTLGGFLYALVIRPITTRKDELAAINTFLAQAKLDSLYIARKEIAKTIDLLDRRKDKLDKVVIEITARLDYTISDQQKALALVQTRLKEEMSKDQSNLEQIKRLTEQVSMLDENIRNTKSATEQIKTRVPAYLSEDDATRIIKENGYYDRLRNSNGVGIENKFELQPGDSLVYDAKTRLTWQQSGSTDPMLFEEAQVYIEQKNRENYGGFSDWRLPTLKEAMSLMSPDKKDYLNIDPLFDKTQQWIWTLDKIDASIAWVVLFNSGYCTTNFVDDELYVRAVRSGR